MDYMEREDMTADNELHAYLKAGAQVGIRIVERAGESRIVNFGGGLK